MQYVNPCSAPRPVWLQISHVLWLCDLQVFNWLYKNENIGFVCSGKKMFMTYHQFLSEQASFTEM